MSNFNLIDVVMAIAASRPEHEALGTAEVSHTYSDLVRLASQCARYFAGFGVGMGDRIAIGLSQPDQAIISMLACWMLGATGMMIDSRTKARERTSIAAFFDLRAIVEVNSFGNLPGCVSIGVGESLVDTIASESTVPCIRPAGVAPALILRTTGTTGTPLGVVFSHEKLMLSHWASASTYLGFDRGLLVHWMPLFYTAGILRAVSQLLDGSPTHFLPSMSSTEELAEKLITSRARIASLVPAQLPRLLSLCEGRPTPLFPDLRVLTGTGSAFPTEWSVRAYHGLSHGFHVLYGSTFFTMISFLKGRDLLSKPETVGRLHPSVHAQVIDPEGQSVGPGEVGLLRLRGPLMADAVIGEPRADSDRISDGWAIPGDVGFIDSDGFLTLTGRASDLIIRKGVNVFPREIEGVLERHDAVMEAAVVGYPDDGAGEEIAAFIVVRGDVTVDELLYHARVHIHADKRPRIIRIVGALPRNDAGKVLKQALLEGFSNLEFKAHHRST